MDPPHEENVQAAKAICSSFLRRLSFLSDAMFESLDDVDYDDTLVPPRHEFFKTNHDYRETFSFVVANEFRFHSWRHQMILSQYHEILRSSVYRDFGLLISAEVYPDQLLAVRRWQSWEVVEARWPFMVPVETKTGDEVKSVCRGMWTALRSVAAAALANEAREGPCEFDVLGEGGVSRRATLTAVPSESSASWIMRYMGGILHSRRKEKTD